MGARRLVLAGGTLLHVAANSGNVEAARLLIDTGADVNAGATIDEHGVGGQTPIFHAVTKFHRGLSVARLLLEAAADLSVRAMVPGNYETSEDPSDCSPLEYARRFPGQAFPGLNGETQRLLTERHRPKP